MGTRVLNHWIRPPLPVDGHGRRIPPFLEEAQAPPSQGFREESEADPGFFSLLPQSSLLPALNSLRALLWLS